MPPHRKPRGMAPRRVERRRRARRTIQVGTNTPRNDRAVSSVVGIILIFGLVVGSLTFTLFLGSQALHDVRNNIGVHNAEYSMREVDSRLSRVAFSDNDVETLDLGSVGGSVHVANQSYMNITVNKSANCRVTIPMGSIVRRSGDGTKTAYEGGGVWREKDNGSVLVSPPDFQYREGTVNFPVVAVGGIVQGGANRLRAKKNVTKSRERSREISQTLSKPSCSPPDNLTIKVHSDYYQAWGRYFRRATGMNVTTHANNDTASVLLTSLGGPAAVSLHGGSVAAQSDYVATVKINGTGYHYNNQDTGGKGWHLPIGVKVSVEGKGVKTFSPRNGIVDRPINMSYGHDDVNNPLVSYEHRKFPSGSVAVPAGKNFSVMGISYICRKGASSPDDYPRSSELIDTGPTYNGRSDNVGVRCDAKNLGNRPYHNVSSLSDSPYLYVFNHTNNSISQKPHLTESKFESVNYDQRPPQDVFPNLYHNPPGPNNAYFDLKKNQAIFIYDLNADQVSNADYNDLLVLVTFHKKGTLSPGSQFSLRISVKSVSVAGS